MKLTFIGSGSAFTAGTNNYHSNMLLTSDSNKHLLIDCGSDARLALHELNKNHRDISDVYISHLHADHVGGLEWLAFTRKFDPACNKPNLYICETLVKRVWNNVLSGGLSSLQIEIATLDSYFNVHPVKENSIFFWENLEFRIMQSVHVMSGFTLNHSYGLIFEINKIKILITTDTQFSPHQMKDFYHLVDYIFQDCETTANPSRVHAHYTELVTLAPAIKEKMWLYHYNPGQLPDAVKDGFRGFVQKGQVFDFDDPETFKSEGQKSST